MTQQGNATNPGFDNPTSQSDRARVLREQERHTNTRAAYDVAPVPLSADGSPRRPSRTSRLGETL